MVFLVNDSQPFQGDVLLVEENNNPIVCTIKSRVYSECLFIFFLYFGSWQRLVELEE